jgi:hypothetical protein
MPGRWRGIPLKGVEMIPKSLTIAAALVSVALVVLPGRAAAASPTVVQIGPRRSTITLAVVRRLILDGGLRRHS